MCILICEVIIDFESFLTVHRNVHNCVVVFVLYTYRVWMQFLLWNERSFWANSQNEIVFIFIYSNCNKYFMSFTLSRCFQWWSFSVEKLFSKHKSAAKYEHKKGNGRGVYLNIIFQVQAISKCEVVLLLFCWCCF